MLDPNIYISNEEGLLKFIKAHIDEIKAGLEVAADTSQTTFVLTIKELSDKLGGSFDRELIEDVVQNNNKLRIYFAEQQVVWDQQLIGNQPDPLSSNTTQDFIDQVNTNAGDPFKAMRSFAKTFKPLADINSSTTGNFSFSSTRTTEAYRHAGEYYTGRLEATINQDSPLNRRLQKQAETYGEVSGYLGRATELDYYSLFTQGERGKQGFRGSFFQLQESSTMAALYNRPGRTEIATQNVMARDYTDPRLASNDPEVRSQAEAEQSRKLGIFAGNSLAISLAHRYGEDADTDSRLSITPITMEQGSVHAKMGYFYSDAEGKKATTLLMSTQNITPTLAKTTTVEDMLLINRPMPQAGEDEKSPTYLGRLHSFNRLADQMMATSNILLNIMSGDSSTPATRSQEFFKRFTNQVTKDSSIENRLHEGGVFTNHEILRALDQTITKAAGSKTQMVTLSMQYLEQALVQGNVFEESTLTALKTLSEEGRLRIGISGSSIGDNQGLFYLLHALEQKDTKNKELIRTLIKQDSLTVLPTQLMHSKSLAVFDKDESGKVKILDYIIGSANLSENAMKAIPETGTTQNIETSMLLRGGLLDLLEDDHKEDITDNYYYGVGRGFNNSLTQGMLIERRGKSSQVENAITMLKALGGIDSQDKSSKGKTGAFNFSRRYILDSSSPDGYRLTGLDIVINNPIKGAKDYTLGFTIGSERKFVSDGLGGGKVQEVPILYINKTQRIIGGAVFKNASHDTYHFQHFNLKTGKVEQYGEVVDGQTTGQGGLRVGETYNANAIDVLGGMLTTMRAGMSYDAEVRALTTAYKGLDNSDLRQSLQDILSKEIQVGYRRRSGKELIKDSNRSLENTLLALGNLDRKTALSVLQGVSDSLGSSSLETTQRSEYQQQRGIDVNKALVTSLMANLYDNHLNAANSAQILTNTFQSLIDTSLGLRDRSQPDGSEFTAVYRDLALRALKGTSAGYDKYLQEISEGMGQIYHRMVDAYQQPHTQNYSQGQALHATPVMGITNVVSNRLGLQGKKKQGILMNPYSLSHGETLGSYRDPLTGLIIQGEFLRGVQKGAGRSETEQFFEAYGGLQKIEGGAPIVYDVTGTSKSMPTLQALKRSTFIKETSSLLAALGISDSQRMAESLAKDSYDMFRSYKDQPENEEGLSDQVLYYFPYAKTEQISQRMNNLTATRLMFDASASFINYALSFGSSGTIYEDTFSKSSSDVISGALPASLPEQQFEALQQEYKERLSAWEDAGKVGSKPTYLQIAKEWSMYDEGLGKGYLGSERPRLLALVAGATQLSDYGLINVNYNKGVGEYDHGMKYLKPHRVQASGTLDSARTSPTTLLQRVQQHLKPGTLFIARDREIESSSLLNIYATQMATEIEKDITNRLTEAGFGASIEDILPKIAVDQTNLTKQGLLNITASALTSAYDRASEISGRTNDMTSGEINREARYIVEDMLNALKKDRPELKVKYKDGRGDDAELVLTIKKGVYSPEQEDGIFKLRNIGDVMPGDAQFTLRAFSFYEKGNQVRVQPLKISMPAHSARELNAITVLGNVALNSNTFNTFLLDLETFTLEDFMSGMRPGTILPKGPLRGAGIELFEALADITKGKGIDLLPDTLKRKQGSEMAVSAEDIFAYIAPSQIKGFNFEMGLGLLSGGVDPNNALYSRLTSGTGLAESLAMMFMKADVGSDSNRSLLLGKLAESLGRDKEQSQYAEALRIKASKLGYSEGTSIDTFKSYEAKFHNAGMSIFTSLAALVDSGLKDNESLESGLLRTIIQVLEEGESSEAAKRLAEKSKGLLDHIFTEENDLYIKEDGKYTIKDSFITKPIGLLAFLAKASSDIYTNINLDQRRQIGGLGEVLLDTSNIFQNLQGHLKGLEKESKSPADQKVKDIVNILDSYIKLAPDATKAQTIQAGMLRRELYTGLQTINKLTEGRVAGAFERIDLLSEESINKYTAEFISLLRTDHTKAGLHGPLTLESRFEQDSVGRAIQGLYSADHNKTLQYDIHRSRSVYDVAVNAVATRLNVSHREVLDKLKENKEPNVLSLFRDSLKEAAGTFYVGNEVVESIISRLTDPEGSFKLQREQVETALSVFKQQGNILEKAQKVGTTSFYSAAEAYAGLGGTVLQKAQQTTAQAFKYSLPDVATVRSILDTIESGGAISISDEKILKEVEITFSAIRDYIQNQRLILMPGEMAMSKIATPTGSKNATALEGHLARSMTKRQLDLYTYSPNEYTDVSTVQEALMVLSRIYEGALPTDERISNQYLLHLDNLAYGGLLEYSEEIDNTKAPSKKRKEILRRWHQTGEDVNKYLSSYNTLFRSALAGEINTADYGLRLLLDITNKDKRGESAALGHMERINQIALGEISSAGDDFEQQTERRLSLMAEYIVDNLGGIQKLETAVDKTLSQFFDKGKANITELQRVYDTIDQSIPEADRTLSVEQKVATRWRELTSSSPSGTDANTSLSNWLQQHTTKKARKNLDAHSQRIVNLYDEYAATYYGSSMPTGSLQPYHHPGLLQSLQAELSEADRYLYLYDAKELSSTIKQELLSSYRTDEILRISTSGGLRSRILNAQSANVGASYLEGMKTLYNKADLHGSEDLKSYLKHSRFIALPDYAFVSHDYEGNIAIKRKHRGDTGHTTGVVLGLDVLEKMSLLFQTDSHPALEAQHRLISQLARTQSIIDRIELSMARTGTANVTSEEITELKVLRLLMESSKETAVSILQNENSIRQATGNRLNMVGASYIAVNSLLVGENEVALGGRARRLTNNEGTGGTVEYTGAARQSPKVILNLLTNKQARQFKTATYAESSALYEAADAIQDTDPAQAERLRQQAKEWDTLATKPVEERKRVIANKLAEVEREHNKISKFWWGSSEKTADTPLQRDKLAQLQTIEAHRDRLLAAQTAALASEQHTFKVQGKFTWDDKSEGIQNIRKTLQHFVDVIDVYGMSQGKDDLFDNETIWNTYLKATYLKAKGLLSDQEVSRLDIESWQNQVTAGMQGGYIANLRMEEVDKFNDKSHRPLTIEETNNEINKLEIQIGLLNKSLNLGTSLGTIDAARIENLTKTKNELVKARDQLNLSLMLGRVTKDFGSNITFLNQRSRTTSVTSVDKLDMLAKYEAEVPGLVKTLEKHRKKKEELERKLAPAQKKHAEAKLVVKEAQSNLDSTLARKREVELHGRKNIIQSKIKNNKQKIEAVRGEIRKELDYINKIKFEALRNPALSNAAETAIFEAKLRIRQRNEEIVAITSLTSSDLRQLQKTQDSLNNLAASQENALHKAQAKLESAESPLERSKKVIDGRSKLIKEAETRLEVITEFNVSLGLLNEWTSRIKEMAKAYNKVKVEEITAASILDYIASSGKGLDLIELEIITGENVTTKNKRKIVEKLEALGFTQDSLVNRSGMPYGSAASSRGEAQGLMGHSPIDMTEEYADRVSKTGSLFGPDDRSTETLMMVSAFGFQFTGLGDFDGDSYQLALTSMTKIRADISRLDQEIKNIDKNVSKAKDAQNQAQDKATREQLKQVEHFYAREGKKLKQRRKERMEHRDKLIRESTEVRIDKVERAQEGTRSYIAEYLALPKYLLGSEKDADKVAFTDSQIAKLVKQYRDTLSGMSDRSKDIDQSIGAFAYARFKDETVTELDPTTNEETTRTFKTVEFDEATMHKVHSKAETARIIAAAKSKHDDFVKYKLQADGLTLEDLDFEDYYDRIVRWIPSVEAIEMTMSVAGKILGNASGSQISSSDLHSIQSLMGQTGGGLLGKVYNTVVPTVTNKIGDHLMNRIMTNQVAREDFQQSVANAIQYNTQKSIKRPSGTGSTYLDKSRQRVENTLQSMHNLSGAGGKPWEIAQKESEVESGTAYRFLLTTQQFLRDTALKPKEGVGLLKETAKFHLSLEAINLISALNIPQLNSEKLSSITGYGNLLDLQQLVPNNKSRQYLEIISQDFLGSAANVTLNEVYGDKGTTKSSGLDQHMTAFAMLRMITDYAGTSNMDASQMVGNEKYLYGAALGRAKENLIERAKTDEELAKRLGYVEGGYVSNDAVVRHVITDLLGKFQSNFIVSSMLEDYESITVDQTENTLRSYGLTIKTTKEGKLGLDYQARGARNTVKYRIQEDIDAYNRKLRLTGDDQITTTSVYGLSEQQESIRKAAAEGRTLDPIAYEEEKSALLGKALEYAEEIKALQAKIKQNVDAGIQKARDEAAAGEEPKTLTIEEVLDIIKKETFNTIIYDTTIKQSDSLFKQLTKLKEFNLSVKQVADEGETSEFSKHIFDALSDAGKEVQVALLDDLSSTGLFGADLEATAYAVDTGKLTNEKLYRAFSTGITAITEAVNQGDGKLTSEDAGAIFSYMAMGGMLPGNMAEAYEEQLTDIRASSKLEEEAIRAQATSERWDEDTLTSELQRHQQKAAEEEAAYKAQMVEVLTSKDQYDAEGNHIGRGMSILETIAQNSGYVAAAAGWASIAEEASSKLERPQDLTEDEIQYYQRISDQAAENLEKTSRMTVGDEALEQLQTQGELDKQYRERIAAEDAMSPRIVEETVPATLIPPQVDMGSVDPDKLQVPQAPQSPTLEDVTQKPTGESVAVPVGTAPDLPTGNPAWTDIQDKPLPTTTFQQIDEVQQTLRRVDRDITRRQEQIEHRREKKTTEESLRKTFTLSETLSILAVPTIFAALQGDIPIGEQLSGLVVDTAQSLLTMGSFEQSSLGSMYRGDEVGLERMRDAANVIQHARMREYFSYYDSPTEAAARGFTNEVMIRGMGMVGNELGAMFDRFRGVNPLAVSETGAGRVITEVAAGMIGKVVSGAVTGAPVGNYNVTQTDIAAAVMENAARSVQAIQTYLMDNLSNMVSDMDDEFNQWTAQDNETGQSIAMEHQTSDSNFNAELNTAFANANEYLHAVSEGSEEYSTAQELGLINPDAEPIVT